MTILDEAFATPTKTKTYIFNPSYYLNNPLLLEKIIESEDLQTLAEHLFQYSGIIKDLQLLNIACTKDPEILESIQKECLELYGKIINEDKAIPQIDLESFSTQRLINLSKLSSPYAFFNELKSIVREKAEEALQERQYADVEKLRANTLTYRDGNDIVQAEYLNNKLTTIDDKGKDHTTDISLKQHTENRLKALKNLLQHCLGVAGIIFNSKIMNKEKTESRIERYKKERQITDEEIGKLQEYEAILSEFDIAYGSYNDYKGYITEVMPAARSNVEIIKRIKEVLSEVRKFDPQVGEEETKHFENLTVETKTTKLTEGVETDAAKSKLEDWRNIKLSDIQMYLNAIQREYQNEDVWYEITFVNGKRTIPGRDIRDWGAPKRLDIAMVKEAEKQHKILEIIYKHYASLSETRPLNISENNLYEELRKNKDLADYTENLEKLIKNRFLRTILHDDLSTTTANENEVRPLNIQALGELVHKYYKRLLNIQLSYDTTLRSVIQSKKGKKIYVSNLYSAALTDYEKIEAVLNDDYDYFPSVPEMIETIVQNQDMIAHQNIKILDMGITSRNPKGDIVYRSNTVPELNEAPQLLKVLESNIADAIVAEKEEAEYHRLFATEIDVLRRTLKENAKTEDQLKAYNAIPDEAIPYEALATPKLQLSPETTKFLEIAKRMKSLLVIRNLYNLVRTEYLPVEKPEELSRASGLINSIRDQAQEALNDRLAEKDVYLKTKRESESEYAPESIEDEAYREALKTSGDRYREIMQRQAAGKVRLNIEMPPGSGIYCERRFDEEALQALDEQIGENFGLYKISYSLKDGTTKEFEAYTYGLQAYRGGVLASIDNNLKNLALRKSGGFINPERFKIEPVMRNGKQITISASKYITQIVARRSAATFDTARIQGLQWAYGVFLATLNPESKRFEIIDPTMPINDEGIPSKDGRTFETDTEARQWIALQYKLCGNEAPKGPYKAAFEVKNKPGQRFVVAAMPDRFTPAKLDELTKLIPPSSGELDPVNYSYNRETREFEDKKRQQDWFTAKLAPIEKYGWDINKIVEVLIRPITAIVRRAATTPTAIQNIDDIKQNALMAIMFCLINDRREGKKITWKDPQHPELYIEARMESDSTPNRDDLQSEILRNRKAYHLERAVEESIEKRIKEIVDKIPDLSKDKEQVSTAYAFITPDGELEYWPSNDIKTLQNHFKEQNNDDSTALELAQDLNSKLEEVKYPVYLSKDSEILMPDKSDVEFLHHVEAIVRSQAVQYSVDQIMSRMIDRKNPDCLQPIFTGLATYIKTSAAKEAKFYRHPGAVDRLSIQQATIEGKQKINKNVPLSITIKAYPISFADNNGKYWICYVHSVNNLNVRTKIEAIEKHPASPLCVLRDKEPVIINLDAYAEEDVVYSARKIIGAISNSYAKACGYTTWSKSAVQKSIGNEIIIPANIIKEAIVVNLVQPQLSSLMSSFDPNDESERTKLSIRDMTTKSPAARAADIDEVKRALELVDLTPAERKVLEIAYDLDKPEALIGAYKSYAPEDNYVWIYEKEGRTLTFDPDKTKRLYIDSKTNLTFEGTDLTVNQNLERKIIELKPIAINILDQIIEELNGWNKERAEELYFTEAYYNKLRDKKIDYRNVWALIVMLANKQNPEVEIKTILARKSKPIFGKPDIEVIKQKIKEQFPNLWYDPRIGQIRLPENCAAEEAYDMYREAIKNHLLNICYEAFGQLGPKGTVQKREVRLHTSLDEINEIIKALNTEFKSNRYSDQYFTELNQRISDLADEILQNLVSYYDKEIHFYDANTKKINIDKHEAIRDSKLSEKATYIYNHLRYTNIHNIKSGTKVQTAVRDTKAIEISNRKILELINAYRNATDPNIKREIESAKKAELEKLNKLESGARYYDSVSGRRFTSNNQEEIEDWVLHKSGWWHWYWPNSRTIIPSTSNLEYPSVVAIREAITKQYPEEDKEKINNLHYTITQKLDDLDILVMKTPGSFKDAFTLNLGGMQLVSKQGELKEWARGLAKQIQHRLHDTHFDVKLTKTSDPNIVPDLIKDLGKEDQARSAAAQLLQLGSTAEVLKALREAQYIDRFSAIDALIEKIPDENLKKKLSMSKLVRKT